MKTGIPKLAASAALALLLASAACADGREERLEDVAEERREMAEEAREGDVEDVAEDRAEMEEELRGAGAPADTARP